MTLVGSTAHWAPAAAARTAAWRIGDLRRRAGGIADAIALSRCKPREADNGIGSIDGHSWNLAKKLWISKRLCGGTMETGTVHQQMRHEFI